MSAIAAGLLLVPPVHGDTRTGFPWWLLVGALPLVVGLLLAGGGAYLAKEMRGKARKPADHAPGLLLLLVGAALALFGLWLV